MNRLPMMTLATVIAVAATCAVGGANAVTIYRCGAAGNAFTDMPCAGGQVFRVDDDSRSNAQRAEAAQVAAADQQLANELMRERVKLAALQPPAAAAITVRTVAAIAPLATVALPRAGKHIARSRAFGPFDDRLGFVAFAPRHTASTGVR